MGLCENVVPQNLIKNGCVIVFAIRLAIHSRSPNFQTHKSALPGWQQPAVFAIKDLSAAKTQRHFMVSKGMLRCPKVDATVMDCMDVYLWNFIHSQEIIGIVSLSISIHLLCSIWTCDLEFIQTNTALNQCWAQFPRLWEYVFVCDRFI